jgi:adenine-specific DNA methylase
MAYVTVSPPVLLGARDHFNVGYADLSDFFYVWLRRSIGDVYPELLGTMLTPKAHELVADPFRHENAG